MKLNPIVNGCLKFHILHLISQLTERALGLHLTDHLGGESAEYHICMARMLLQKHAEEEAEEWLKQALECDHQVRVAT